MKKQPTHATTKLKKNTDVSQGGTQKHFGYGCVAGNFNHLVAKPQTNKICNQIFKPYFLFYPPINKLEYKFNCFFFLQPIFKLKAKMKKRQKRHLISKPLFRKKKKNKGEVVKHEGQRSCRCQSNILPTYPPFKVNPPPPCFLQGWSLTLTHGWKGI